MKKVYLIHGSLGSGKTTLLNNLLSKKEFRKSVIIENEFASFSIDDFLIKKNIKNDNMQTISGGCICCTSGQEFIDCFDNLVRLSNIDKIIIESTGVANSIEIIKHLILSSNFETDFEFGANVMLFDALEDDVNQFLKNKYSDIIFSDLILITKSDIVNKNRVKNILSKLNTVNDNVDICVKGTFSNQNLFKSDYKSSVVDKLKNNIKLLTTNEKIKNQIDNYHVLKLNNNIDKHILNDFINQIYKLKEMKVRRIKGFFVDKHNKTLIINSTPNNIEYLNSFSKINYSILIIIGENIDSTIIDRLKSNNAL